MAQAPLCQKQVSSGSRRWIRQPWVLLACTLLLAVATTNADPIVSWNFNSPQPDATTTGTTAPSSGAGTITLIGGVTGVFSSGDSNSDPGGGADNSGWNTSGYPAAETGTGTAGIEFRAGTAGYENIVVKWSQRNSA